MSPLDRSEEHRLLFLHQSFWDFLGPDGKENRSVAKDSHTAEAKQSLSFTQKIFTKLFLIIYCCIHKLPPNIMT